MSAIRNIDGPKDFIFRVLSGVAIGIVGLVPNAILEIFKYLMQYQPIFKTLLGSRASHPIYCTGPYRCTYCYEI